MSSAEDTGMGLCVVINFFSANVDPVELSRFSQKFNVFAHRFTWNILILVLNISFGKERLQLCWLTHNRSIGRPT
jgi:hypothetical protein